MAGKSNCSITQAEFDSVLERNGGALRKAARELGVDASTVSRWRKNGVPKSISQKLEAQKKAGEMPKGAVNISGLRKSPRKPNTGCKPFFHEIPNGVGYPIEVAAEDWGFSVETIRRVSLELGARVYVETSKDVWIEMVIKPKG